MSIVNCFASLVQIDDIVLDDIMLYSLQVKVLYVRNLMLTTAEQQIEEAFSVHAPVERVKKIKDYAFVHFHSKEAAHSAMQAMNSECVCEVIGGHE